MSLVDTHIRAAITTEMLRKGYVEALAGATADLLLDYEAARTETREILSGSASASEVLAATAQLASTPVPPASKM